MTTAEKREAIDDFCVRHRHSEQEGTEEVCPFEHNEFCDNYNAWIASPEIIDQWYALFFENDKPTPTIKDSGERTEFSTGAVRDMHTGKGRMDLLPWSAIMEVSKHCENGALKYGEHNVDRGIPTHSLCDSAARHLAKYLDGWTDEPHLLAAAWNLLWAVQMEVKHPNMVDTPWTKKEG